MILSTLIALTTLSHAEEPASTAIVAVTPTLIPVGFGVRVHQASGSHSAVSVGGSLGAAVFDLSDTTPLRGTVDLGADYYPVRRFHGLFLGARASVAGWTAAPLLGGSNVNGGFALGGRVPAGESGASVGFEAGARVHKYFTYRLSESSDGVQALPDLRIDFAFPIGRNAVAAASE